MVAPALIGALIGGAYGGLTYGQDKRDADAERRAQAIIESNSPWTKMHGHTVGGPSMLGNIEGGALTGATFGAKNFMNKDDKTASPEAQTSEGSPSPAVDESGFQPHTYARHNNFVEPAAQNQGQGSTGYDWSDPKSVGYSPWNDLGLMPIKPQQRPQYIPPGS